MTHRRGSGLRIPRLEARRRIDIDRSHVQLTGAIFANVIGALAGSENSEQHWNQIGPKTARAATVRGGDHRSARVMRNRALIPINTRLDPRTIGNNTRTDGHGSSSLR